MLTSTEWTLVTEFAQTHLLATPEPHLRLSAHFPPEFVNGLTLGTRASDNAIALISAVRAHGPRGDDPPVLQLLRALLTAPELATLPVAHRLRRMLRRAEQAVQAERDRLLAAGDPFLINVLAGNEVFLDRLELREALRTLTEDPVKIVLQVTGAPSTGKSYSYHLISYLSEVQEFTPALVPLDSTFTSVDVVRWLGLRVAPDQPIPPLEDDRKKWNGYAALWLVTQAAQRGGPWWFVLDGLNHLPPTSDVHDLVHDLALAILNYKRSQTRLVLLGYDGSLPIDLRKRHVSEEVRLLTEPDVREFFGSYYLQRHISACGSDHQVDLEQVGAEVDATVDQVVAFARTASARGGCYMRELARAVEEAIDEYAGWRCQRQPQAA
jgi:hypothetical protein